MKRLSIRPSLTPTPPPHPPTAPMSVASAGMKHAWLQVVTERPGVKKEWGTQKSILPAPPVAFRPRPSSSCGLPGEPHGGDAQPPVWPGAAAHTAAPAGTAGSPPIIAAPALPHATLPLVERSAADSTSDRLAFITQCLQVLLIPPETPPPHSPLPLSLCSRPPCVKAVQMAIFHRFVDGSRCCMHPQVRTFPRSADGGVAATAAALSDPHGHTRSLPWPGRPCEGGIDGGTAGPEPAEFTRKPQHGEH